MKKLLLLCPGMLATAFVSAQSVSTEKHNPDGSYYKQCVRFRETEPIWQMAQKHPGVTHFATPKVVDDRETSSRPVHEGANPNACTTDGALQTEAGTMENKAPIVSFDGAKGQGYVPLDPNGMIGSNYYVQTINSTYAVWNKNGTAKLAETDLANLFGKFTSDEGDPVTMYDKFADRWILTEFQPGSGNNIDTMMFAVSETNDPTGKFYLYYFCYDNTETSDYPKYTIWADGYYETCNCSPNDYVVVYDRTSMLAGVKTAGFIKISYTDSPFNSNCGGGFYCPMTLMADGTLPPYGSPCYMFDFQDPNWGGSCATTNAIRVFSVSVNWTSKTGSIALAQTLTTTSFNSLFPNDNSNSLYRHDIDQPSSKNYESLDASDGFFSYRIPYMRWGSYNSAVMCNVVVSGTHPTSKSPIAGVRWYELRQDTTTKSWSIYQQSTYAPSDNVSRWCPAIAMDENGSIGLQYTVSDPISVYPGLRYTGRTSCDALGTMTLAEGTAATGNSIANTSLRWGDYSHLSVDPIDGITFWGTSMYANKSVSGSAVISHIYSFQIPKCVTTGVSNIELPQAELSAYQSGNVLNVSAVKLPQADNYMVELFDLNGKRLTGKNIAASSELKTTFDVASLAKGIYFVRITNDSFQRVVKVPVN
ncbi:MAG TPA: T9SS type A sorting domain-containing protein [Bacteroidia bacterium]|jgi:hypothetical protein|nr:T9SS type A sorting domain-containing protein [Bacteroidia bacterium]